MAEIRIKYAAFAEWLAEYCYEDDPRKVTEVVVDWAEADDLSDEEVREAVFHQTNTYRGSLWDLVEPLLSPVRTHTAVTVGDEVTVRGITYRCEPVGWSAVAVEIAAHDALLGALLGEVAQRDGAGARF